MCGEKMVKRLLKGHETEACKYRLVPCPHGDCNKRIRACDVKAHENKDCKSTWCVLRRKIVLKERMKFREQQEKEMEEACAKMGMSMEDYKRMQEILKNATA
jgi:hypothetical protein